MEDYHKLQEEYNKELKRFQSYQRKIDSQYEKLKKIIRIHKLIGKELDGNIKIIAAQVSNRKKFLDNRAVVIHNKKLKIDEIKYLSDSVDNLSSQTAKEVINIVKQVIKETEQIETVNTRIKSYLSDIYDDIEEELSMMDREILIETTTKAEIPTETTSSMITEDKPLLVREKETERLLAIDSDESRPMVTLVKPISGGGLKINITMKQLYDQLWEDFINCKLVTREQQLA